MKTVLKLVSPSILCGSLFFACEDDSVGRGNDYKPNKHLNYIK